MKINEVFAGLINDPSNVYEVIRYDLRYQLFINLDRYFYLRVFNKQGELIPPEKGAGGFSGNFLISDEWQLVRKPVPWQEAIEAYAKNHKNLEIILDNMSFIQHSNFPLGVFENTPLGLNPKLFTEGKWYIND